MHFDFLSFVEAKENFLEKEIQLFSCLWETSSRISRLTDLNLPKVWTESIKTWDQLRSPENTYKMKNMLIQMFEADSNVWDGFLTSNKSGYVLKIFKNCPHLYFWWKFFLILIKSLASETHI